MTRFLLATVLLTGCATLDRTEVVVSIDADGPVRARATGLRVEIRGGSGHDPSGWGSPMVRSEPITWPVQIGIVPLGDDTGRSFEVRAVATGAGGGDVSVARTVSSFDPQHTSFLPMTIEGACAFPGCSAAEACRAGTCSSPYVPPTNVDAAPVDYAGMYNVAATAGANGCMVPSWTVGAVSRDVPAMVMQMPDGHVTVDITGAVGLYLDVVEHSHRFEGVVVGNHLSATLVGTNASTSMGCTYTFNALLTLDLAGNMANGNVEVYAVAPDTAACAFILGCSTNESLVCVRM